MSYLLAIFLPGIAVMLKGRIGLGLLLCLLHLTIIGWLPASIVAFAIINEQNRKAEMKRLTRHTVPQPPLRVPWP